MHNFSGCLSRERVYSVEQYDCGTLNPSYVLSLSSKVGDRHLGFCPCCKKFEQYTILPSPKE